MAQGGHSGVVKGQSEDPLAHPVVCQAAGKLPLVRPAQAGIRMAFPPQPGPGLQRALRFGQGEQQGRPSAVGWAAGVFRMLPGEQGEHHLLHRIAVVVPNEIQAHQLSIASRM